MNRVGCQVREVESAPGIGPAAGLIDRQESCPIVYRIDYDDGNAEVSRLKWRSERKSTAMVRQDGSETMVELEEGAIG